MAALEGRGGKADDQGLMVEQIPDSEFLFPAVTFPGSSRGKF